MRAFVRLVAQHLILLILLVFVCIGVVFRQPIFAPSVARGPQPEGAGAHPSGGEVGAAVSPGPGAFAAPGSSAPQGAVAQMPGSQAANEGALPEAPPSAGADAPAPAPLGQQGLASGSIVNSALTRGAASEAAPVPPSQVPQYLSGKPVTASGYTFRPFKPAGDASPEIPPDSGPQDQPLAQAEDAAVPPVASLGQAPSAGTDTAVSPGAEGPPGRPTAGRAAVARQGVSSDQRLNEARRAFWDGNMGLARELYEALAREDGHDPELLGEIGNFYYQVGNSEDAAKTYLAAALGLLEAGRRPEAEGLLETIRSLDPAKAAELAQRLGQ